jgi:hypothetical protein
MRPRLILATLAVAALAVLGWPVFRGNRNAPPTIRPAAQVPLAAPPAAPDGPNVYQIYGYNELLGLLRGKLKGPACDFSAALAEIAKTRPGLAVDLALALGPTEKEKSAWVADLVKKWAGRDPSAAWQWLQQQASRLDPLADGSLTGVVFDAMAARDPQMLLATMNALLFPGNSVGPLAADVAVRTGLQSLVDSGHVDLAQQAVEGWANSPLKPDIGASAYETVAIAMGRTAPDAAGAWLKSLPATAGLISALAGFAANWSERDPVAALAWAETLTPQEDQSVAINRVFGDWVERNAGDAGEWLSDDLSHLSSSDETDTRIEALINRSSTVRDTPALALQWATLISDPQTRENTEENLLAQWARSDLAAATGYVKNNPAMAPEQKQALIQKMQSSPPPDN